MQRRWNEGGRPLGEEKEGFKDPLIYPVSSERVHGNHCSAFPAAAQGAGRWGPGRRRAAGSDVCPGVLSLALWSVVEILGSPIRLCLWASGGSSSLNLGLLACLKGSALDLESCWGLKTHRPEYVTVLGMW